MLTARRATAGAIAALLAGPAGAVEWSLTGVTSQTFSANTNVELDVEDPGPAFGSVTAIDVTLAARTRRTEWALTTGGQLAVFGGPGATDDLETPNPRLAGSVRYLGERFTVSGNFGFSRESTSFLDITPISIVPPDDPTPDPVEGTALLERGAIRTSISASSGLTYRLTPRDRVFLNASGDIQRFSVSTLDLTDNSSINVRSGWTRATGPDSSVGWSVSYSQFTSDNLEETTGYSISSGGDFTTDITQSTSLEVSLGLSYTDSDELDFTTSDEGISRSQNNFGVSGRVSATFRRSDQTAVSVFASQAVRPSSIGGDIANVLSFGGSLNHALTRQTALNVVAEHSITADLEDDEISQSFVVSPGLTFRITPLWQAQAGYSFRLVDDETGRAFNNQVFVGVSRSLQFFP